MLACWDSHTAVPSAVREVGRKPPENQPELTPAAFRRFPMLRPVIAILATSGGLQSSNFAASPPVAITVPLATAGVGFELITARLAPAGVSFDVIAPWVCPEIRLRWPGVVGPKTVE